MGYTTDFWGSFELSRQATDEEKEYINKLSDTRRMKRDVNKLKAKFNGKYGFNGEYGNEGEYFVGGGGVAGQEHDDTIIDYNTAPGQIGYHEGNYDFNERWNENQRRINEGECQPGLWCQWVITPDGKYLEWNGAEKFYEYVAWLEYLINHFFSKWGISLNGEVEYQGEEEDDNGRIVILGDNKVFLNPKEKELRKYKLLKLEEKNEPLVEE